MARAVRVVQFQRRAVGGFSVERLFADVRSALPADVSVELRTNHFPSRGLLGRAVDALLARRRRGEVNHILGDVHYLAWFLPRKRTVVTVLDCVSLERLRGARRAALWLLWYWLPLQHADHVTVISEYTREALLGWVRYPPDRIHVIRPPVSNEFKPWPAPRRGERLRLLHVGTGPHKNLRRVIEAARPLPVTLVIIGKLDAATEDALAGIPHENHYNLTRAEIVEQYRLADALVFASTYEGWGLPIIEAQATGRPVITSSVCSMPEAAGGAAIIVDPTDVNAIRAAILRIIDDPDFARALVHRGFENAALYAADRVAAQYADLYRTISAANS
ncbi:N/A [soil metagenome]